MLRRAFHHHALKALPCVGLSSTFSLFGDDLAMILAAFTRFKTGAALIGLILGHSTHNPDGFPTNPGLEIIRLRRFTLFFQGRGGAD
jgi:hypothetical protein